MALLQGRKVFVVDEAVHPQTIAVVKTRAEPFGIEVRVCDASAYNYSAKDACGVLLQYPDSMYRFAVPGRAAGGLRVRDLIPDTFLAASTPCGALVWVCCMVKRIPKYR